MHGAGSFVTVRLSGLVHTTDRLALRSIAVQLQEQRFGTAGLFADEGDYVRRSFRFLSSSPPPRLTL